MKSRESQVAAQIRLNQWALEVQECINRPKGMTVDEWCEQHNIKKSELLLEAETCPPGLSGTVGNYFGQLC